MQFFTGAMIAVFFHAGMTTRYPWRLLVGFVLAGVVFHAMHPGSP